MVLVGQFRRILYISFVWNVINIHKIFLREEINRINYYSRCFYIFLASSNFSNENAFRVYFWILFSAFIFFPKYDISLLTSNIASYLLTLLSILATIYLFEYFSVVSIIYFINITTCYLLIDFLTKIITLCWVF